MFYIALPAVGRNDALEKGLPNNLLVHMHQPSSVHMHHCGEKIRGRAGSIPAASHIGKPLVHLNIVGYYAEYPLGPWKK